MSEADQDTNQLSRQTTPTWEMELLISGATVFGLMQLPQPLNRALSIWMNSNEAGIANLLAMLSIYLQIALITLILTFVLHLIARGYWVALVGMCSVYPDGIKWDKMKSLGPAYRDVSQSDMGTTKEMIERADNRATLIFGLGFGMALSLMVPVIMVGVMLLVLLFLQMLNYDVQKWYGILWAVVLVIFAPWFLMYLIDYQFGKKLELLKKNDWLKKMFSFYHQLGMRHANNAVVTIYTTNSGIKKNIALVIIAFFISIIFSFTMLSAQGRYLDNGAYDGLPKASLGSEHVLRPQHYASLRTEPLDLNLSAYIDDPVVSAAYLKVFIPYQPKEHAALIKKICPGTLNKKASNENSSLECLRVFHDLRLDEKPVQTDFIAGTDAKTGQRGMIAMIDVRLLGQGRHVLLIKDVPSDKDDSDKPSQNSKLQTDTQKIPFWR